MSILNTISGVANKVSIGGSALSLVGMGTAFIKGYSDGAPKRGIEGFLFDIPLTENATFAAQITDHFAEDNSTIQDHIALEPIRITLTGKVGELVYTREAGLTFLKAMVDRLSPLGVLSPSLGLQATKAIAAAYEVKAAIDVAKNAYTSLTDIFKDNPSLNKQQTAYAKFESLFMGRSLISVETPWKTYTNMAIESWSADQDAESIMETTFTLSFKQMRFIGTTTNTGKLVGRIAAMKGDINNSGPTNGATSGSIATKLYDGARGR
jgi:hypothetical protein